MTSAGTSTRSAASLPVDAVVIGVAKGAAGVELAPGSEAVADLFDGGPAGLLATLATLGATGKEGEAVKIPAPQPIAAPLILAVGLEGGRRGAGLDTAWDLEVLRRAAGLATRCLRGKGKVGLALPAATPEAVEALALGSLLGAYEFPGYRTATQQGEPVRTVIVVIPPAMDHAEAERSVLHASVVGEELNRARDLVNRPANDLHPEAFAAAVKAVGQAHGLRVDVLDDSALAEAGFGGILGVGQGSAHPPRLVRISYAHPRARTHLAYIGKGITYDSGGISLKPVGFNEIMKRDMSGAAAVFAAVVALARLGVAVRVDGWLPLAENMPSGSAVRPGDVLRMYGHKTVEVVNTDAEGRLVLADAIVRAGEEKPDAMVDVATLTAAMKMALGHRIFGVMSNDEALRSRILDAADRTGEEAWPMPLPAQLLTGLESDVADIANSGERMGGGLAAGLFLQHFVPDGVPWAHLDIAGPAYHEAKPYGYTPRGGTGTAVRTLIRLAEEAVQAPLHAVVNGTEN